MGPSDFCVMPADWGKCIPISCNMEKKIQNWKKNMKWQGIHKISASWNSGDHEYWNHEMRESPVICFTHTHSDF